jgi:hypothetical protein
MRMPFAQMDRTTPALIESEVRQWLRDRAGVAFCASCVTMSSRSLLDRPSIEAAVVALARRSAGFLPGRCRCGKVGVRYYPPTHCGADIES